MIVAQRKNIPELLSILDNHRKVLLLGCGTCVTVDKVSHTSGT